MASLDDLQTALKNADAAGDAASAMKLADAIHANSLRTHTVTAGQSEAGLNMSPLQDEIHHDVLSQMSGPARFAAGMGMNLAKIGRFTGNKLGIIPDQNIKDAAEIDKPLEKTPGGAAGDFAGNAAWSVLPGMGATGAVGRLGAIGAKVAASPITRGVVEGAVQGGMNAPPGQTGKGILMGAGAGSLLPAGIKGAQILARGVKPTLAARILMNRGVDLTPGQMNPTGMANQMESSWQSVPVIGPALSNARKAAENQYKGVLIKETAAPGATLSNSTDMNQLLDEAYKSFGPAYDKAKGFPLILEKGKPVIVNQGANMPLPTAFQKIVKDKGVLASASTRSNVGGWLDNQLTKPIKDSGDLLSMRSQIRTKIRSIKGTSQDDLATKELLSNAEDAVTQSLESQLPKDASDALKATDAQYGKYKIVENAVAKGGDKEFTTFQASKAVREATDKGAYARGGGRLRDLTAAGAESFADTPQTGARLASIGLPMAAIAAKPAIGIPAAAATAAMALTKTGRRLAAGDTALQGAMRTAGAATARATPNEATRQAIGQLLNRGNVAALDKWLNTRSAANP